MSLVYFVPAALANDLWVRNIPSHTLFAFFSNIDENNDHLISFDELLHAYPSISRTGFLSTLSSFVSVYSPDFNNEFSVRPEVESTKRGWDAWLPSILGGLAGSISKTATSPLERLRVYYQTGYPGGESVSAERNQMRDAVKRIYQEGGLTAFWRGNLLNCIKIAPETAINFAVFDRAQNYFKETRGNVGNLERLTNGAIAGIVSQASVYAIDTIRTRMMSNLDATSVGGNHPPASVRAVFREIQAQSGIAGFYRGIVPASIGIAPYSAIYFWSFETLKSWYAHKSGLESAGSYAILGMGSVAAIVAGVSTYPFGLIRTRMMAQGSKAHPFVSLSRHSGRRLPFCLTLSFYLDLQIHNGLRQANSKTRRCPRYVPRVDHHVGQICAVVGGFVLLL